VADFDLSGKDSGLIVIEEFEKWDVSEFFGIAGHGGFSLFSGWPGGCREDSREGRISGNRQALVFLNSLNACLR
jgi:hypothetical protein